MRPFFLLFALLAGMVIIPAHAESPAATPNPVVRLDNKTNEMMKGLDETQTKQFAAIRAAHGVVRGVYNVRDSLNRAVKSCIKTNPDMKEKMTASFDSWKTAILPVLRRSENRLDKLILLQTFTRPSTMRAYLKIFDDAVKYQNNQYTEVPISEKGACKDMAGNMDTSQKSLTVLLVQTLGLDQDPTDPAPLPETKTSGPTE